MDKLKMHGIENQNLVQATNVSLLGYCNFLA